MPATAQVLRKYRIRVHLCGNKKKKSVFLHFGDKTVASEMLMYMRKRNLILILMTATVLSASQVNATAAIRSTPADSLIYARTMQKLMPYAGLPAGELMVRTAELFYGTPYKSGTLESVPEELTVNLHETDCILLVEACTAMTLLLKDNAGDGIPPFRDFCAMLRSLRYRDGIINGYPSRLHYTSEWLLQASSNGFLREVTQALGGIPLEQEFSFISSHRDNYPQLRDDPEATELIRKVERRLDTTASYCFIPAGKIGEAEDGILDGDIICIVSTIPGLDITHTGIACRTPDGKLHFIHASMREGKVVLETRTLVEYVKKGGIRVARLNNTKNTHNFRHM